jgi:hypothetical protein
MVRVNDESISVINDYTLIKEQCILNYKFLGCILSILGGFGVILNTRVKS